MIYSRASFKQTKFTASQVQVAKTPLATFESNVSGLYIPEILAYIQTSQSGSGDPSPSNPRAINGVSEVTTTCNAVNQWDEEWEVGGYDTTTGQKNTATNRIRSSNYIVVSPSTTYYFVNANIAYRVFFYTANKTYISNTAYNATSHEVSIPDNCRFITFQMGGDYGTTYNNNVSINYPATDTAYHAYTGTTATTDLGGTYYGGYLNVTTGVLTVTHAKLAFGDMNITKSSTDIFNAYLDNAKEIIDNNIISDCMEWGGTNRTWLNDKTFAICPWASTSATRIAIKGDGTESDVTALLANIGNYYIVYELATPQTYQLTPAQIEQLLGQNNVFCSTGDVAVKYYAIS